MVTKMATKKKQTTKQTGPGRPKTLDASLDKRWQIRCNSRDQLLWEALARFLNLGDASTLVRKLCNDTLRTLTPKQREEIEAIADQLAAEHAREAA
jgi:hypothetical protein